MGSMPTWRGERRASLRHRLAVPVQVDDARGWTRDVSVLGVFFTLSDGSFRPPEPSEVIRFRLTLEHADPRGPLHVDCEGHVVRVEGGPEALGVAVSVVAFDFDAG